MRPAVKSRYYRNYHCQMRLAMIAALCHGTSTTNLLALLETGGTEQNRRLKHIALFETDVCHVLHSRPAH